MSETLCRDERDRKPAVGLPTHAVVAARMPTTLERKIRKIAIDNHRRVDEVIAELIEVGLVELSLETDSTSAAH